MVIDSICAIPDDAADLVLYKDPNKAMVRIYKKLPNEDEFEEEE